MRGLTSLPTSIAFSIFYSFGFQIIGPEGGVQNCGSWRRLANIGTVSCCSSRRALEIWGFGSPLSLTHYIILGK